MNSFITNDFKSLYQKIPLYVKKQSEKAYKLWKDDPNHPSLQFKKIHATEQIYSVRIGLHWRALGLRDGENIYWFWIGSHSDYDKLVNTI